MRKSLRATFLGEERENKFYNIMSQVVGFYFGGVGCSVGFGVGGTWGPAGPRLV